eukprot:8839239-Lingulodinium_polyedra.AAC.1
MFVAAAVLSRDGLQGLARMLQAVCEPLYTSHSEHARALRGGEATLSFYLEAAQGAWWQDLANVLAVLYDPTKLAHIGFTATYTPKKGSAILTDPALA